jgi:hypothetical protein
MVHLGAVEHGCVSYFRRVWEAMVHGGAPCRIRSKVSKSVVRKDVEVQVLSPAPMISILYICNVGAWLASCGMPATFVPSLSLSSV